MEQPSFKKAPANEAFTYSWSSQKWLEPEQHMGAALTVGDTLSEQNVGVRQEPHSPSITTTEEVVKGVIKRLLQNDGSHCF